MGSQMRQGPRRRGQKGSLTPLSSAVGLGEPKPGPPVPGAPWWEHPGTPLGPLLRGDGRVGTEADTLTQLAPPPRRPGPPPGLPLGSRGGNQSAGKALAAGSGLEMSEAGVGRSAGTRLRLTRLFHSFNHQAFLGSLLSAGTRCWGLRGEQGGTPRAGA